MEFFYLSGAFGIEVLGPHAERYLNARLTSNIRDLKIGTNCLAASLTPQGRVEGFFSVLRIEKEKFLLLCDGGDKEEVLNALTRYVVADRVTFSPLSNDFKYLHAAAPVEKLKITSDDTLYLIPRNRTVGNGVDIASSRLEKILEQFKTYGATLISNEDRHVRRIRANMPSFPEELNSRLLFAEASIEDAVSYTKGCYVGQEVMEKIDSHGKTENLLSPFEAKAGLEEVKVGTVISNSEGPIGKIISCYPDSKENGVVGFARIKRDKELVSAILPSGKSVRFL